MYHLFSDLYPDNTFEIFIDQTLINKGNLLEDMDPPVVPPHEIEDPKDVKPADWDDRRQIPDPSITKPADWYTCLTCSHYFAVDAPRVIDFNLWILLCL